MFGVQTFALPICVFMFLFFNDTATTEIYTLSLHDALPILHLVVVHVAGHDTAGIRVEGHVGDLDVLTQSAHEQLDSFFHGALALPSLG